MNFKVSPTVSFAGLHYLAIPSTEMKFSNILTADCKFILELGIAKKLKESILNES